MWPSYTLGWSAPFRETPTYNIANVLKYMYTAKGLVRFQYSGMYCSGCNSRLHFLGVVLVGSSGSGSILFIRLGVQLDLHPIVGTTRSHHVV